LRGNDGPRHHARDDEAAPAFKKNAFALVEEIAAQQAREIWFQDEPSIPLPKRFALRNLWRIPP
jgi:hypothetical protein